MEGFGVGPGGQTMVQIFVRGLEGRSLAVDVAHGSSVGDFKAALREMWGMPSPEEQRLSHGGERLDDDEALVIEDCGIEAGDTIHLSSVLRGGMPKKGGKKGGKEKKSKEPVRH